MEGKQSQFKVIWDNWIKLQTNSNSTAAGKTDLIFRLIELVGLCNNLLTKTQTLSVFSMFYVQIPWRVISLQQEEQGD